MIRVRTVLVCLTLLFASAEALSQEEESPWNHPRFRPVSTTRGDLEPPNGGNQQTASLVADFDQSGVRSFVIAERTQAPSVVWYRREGERWERYVIEEEALRIEAGGAAFDITGNGYPDLVLCGDAQSNQVWWWENPGPPYDSKRRWKRRLIKNSGARKHHDALVGDFTGDGRNELIFWNQGGGTLILAEIPEHSRSHQGEWTLHTIYRYSADGEMEHRGEYPRWRRVHEHEGLARIDINRDGRLDIVGGGRWFEHAGNYEFNEHIIDAAYTFVRMAAGDLVEGKRPEAVAVVGDGIGPLMMYEWKEGIWKSRVLLENVQDGHSLQVIDFNKDGRLDIFVAEMQLGSNPLPRTLILLGDGRGGFTTQELLRGYGLHESRLVDLTGDGLLDILAKPYTWQAPRLDLWIHQAEAPSTR